MNITLFMNKIKSRNHLDKNVLYSGPMIVEERSGVPKVCTLKIDKVSILNKDMVKMNVLPQYSWMRQV
jgi:hypothetical protein